MIISPRIACDDPQTILQNITPPLYDRLSHTLNILVEKEYSIIIHKGLTENFSLGIFEFLYNELSKITQYKYREWCESTTTIIIENINLCIISIREVNKLLHFTSNELFKLVYHIITYQLYDESKINSLLDNIFYYEESSTNSSDIQSSTDINDLSSVYSESDNSDEN